MPPKKAKSLNLEKFFFKMKLHTWINQKIKAIKIIQRRIKQRFFYYIYLLQKLMHPNVIGLRKKVGAPKDALEIKRIYL